jgi:hypothetical protein
MITTTQSHKHWTNQGGYLSTEPSAGRALFCLQGLAPVLLTPAPLNLIRRGQDV